MKEGFNLSIFAVKMVTIPELMRLPIPQIASEAELAPPLPGMNKAIFSIASYKNSEN